VIEEPFYGLSAPVVETESVVEEPFYGFGEARWPAGPSFVEMPEPVVQAPVAMPMAPPFEMVQPTPAAFYPEPVTPPPMPMPQPVAPAMPVA